MKKKILISVVMSLILVGCTMNLNFQNIASRGNATDIGEQKPNVSPDISPNLVIPASAL